MIRSQVWERADELRKGFAGAQPFRHLVIDDFLEQDACESLGLQFPPFRAADAVGDRGEPGGKAVRADLPALGPAFAEFDRILQSPSFLHWLGAVCDIPGLLYDPEYVGGGTHESVAGEELDPHVDFNYHPKTGLHRRLNLILFLNREWDEKWGGTLELYRDPWALGGRVGVLPSWNRCVVFETTEVSWHGFPRIDLPTGLQGLSRRSIAVYFYSRERPADETAPRHTTYYVQRPLPGRIAAGHTLSEADVEQLRGLLARRDARLRDLWAREIELREFIEGIERSPSHRLGRLLTWPARKLRGLIG